MKHPRLTSRPFFQAHAGQPQGPAIPLPTFNAIASNTTFGPLTDLSMGWDGTLWGIDAQGAPHVYNALNDAWVQHGDGIDAAATTPDGSTAYFFKGGEVISLNLATMQASPPQPIGSLWPNLPDSFKLGVSGSCTGVGGVGSLTLFNGGRYVSTDGALPLSKLTAIPGWPQTPNWKDGLFDMIYAGSIGSGRFHVVSNGEFMLVDPAGQGRILIGPAPFSQTDASKAVPAAWGAKFDGGIALAIGGVAAAWYFRGTAMASSAATSAQLQYLGNLSASWPATWHPVLRHAPNGRDGNLLSVLPAERDSWILQHNGDVWTQVKNQADHVGVGQDNAVMIASAQRLWRFTGTWDGTGFTPVSLPSNLIQVSLGNAKAVFARDSGNNVYGFDPASGALTPNANAGTATHIAATSDGTLLHAKLDDPNLHRLLTSSDLPAQAISVQQDLTAAVTKVAATGFGAAHCLAQDSQGNAQAYRYDSPYVFASANNYEISGLGYSQIAQGLGNVYFVDNLSNSVVAVDAHTGAKATRSAPSSADGSTLYTNVVFDPANKLVYLGTYNWDWLDRITPGQLLALDARDLSKVVWSFNATAGINVRPSLAGNALVFGDRNGTIYAFDTLAAAAAPANVQPRATWTLEQINLSGGVTYTGVPDGGMATFAPAITVGEKYFLSLCFSFSLVASAPYFVDHFCAVWLEAGATGPQSYNTNEFHGVNIQYAPDNAPWLNQNTPPIVAKLLTQDSGNSRQTCVFVDCADAVVRINPDGSTKQFAMPTGSTVQTGLGWDADAAAVWFGDNNGNLYGMDGNVQPLAHTPALISPESPMAATPLPYTDLRGNKTVFAGGSSGTTAYGHLFGFDPVSGNIASVQTGVTQIQSLSSAVTQGVLYVGGFASSLTDLALTPQVYGVRVDTLTQGQRYFIIESQLMQDPLGSGDSITTAPDGNVIPPSVARYQTHLTVVDDQKTPLPKETVKIWADVANTVITVAGTPHTIGPDDLAYASVTTGVDGSLVIVSDATNVNASALRVWASFMDPFERIVIYPDHEWHGRAAQSNANANQSDPAQPNLDTVYKYDGGTLFSQDEKTQGMPGNVANAVSQMNAGLNPGGNKPAALAGALKTLHASSPVAPYVAYTDLGGMHYGPNNARAKRPATIAAPIGFVLNKPQGGAHTFTPMSHSDARNAIDALDGTPWDPKNPNGAAASDAPVTFVVRGSGNIFTDFWNWLVGATNQAVQAIENVIVSVADDVMVGINFIVGGITYVFKAIIKVVDDVVNAIGSFFLQLAKLIEEVIEALSVLFHFGEIIWTHRWLIQQLTTLKDDVKGVIKNTVKPILAKAIADAEQAVAQFFPQFEAALGLNDQVNSVQGSGSTPHSAYTVNGSSNAVQASWGTQNLKNGMTSSGGGGTPSALMAPRMAGDDPLADFFANFWTSITTGQNAEDFNQLKTDFNNLFTATSARSFFDALLKTLIDAVETLVELGLTIAGDLLVGTGDPPVGGLCDFVDEAIDFIWEQVLNFQIEIPVISGLYQLLFNEPLTLLNAAMLVTAIPVTVVFRLIEGQYPSQVLQPISPFSPGTSRAVAAANSAPALGSTAAPLPAQKAILITNGVFSIIYGIASAIGDNPQVEELSPWVGRFSAGLGFVMTCFSAPWISTDSDQIGPLDWEPWGFGTAFALVYIVTLKTDSEGNPIGDQESLPFMVSGLSGILLLWYILQFVEEGKRDPTTNLGFSSALLTTFPGLINAVKLAPEYGPPIVAVADVACNFANLFVAIFQANSLSSPS